MKKQLLVIFGILLVFANFLLAQQKRDRFNPIIPDFLADPSLVFFNDTFYMYATTDIDQGLRKMGPPVVWKSSNFVDWHFDGTILQQIDWDKEYPFINEKGEQKSGFFRYWAPGKPLQKDGLYYLFPTIVTPDEKMGTYVVTSQKPDGPFSFINGNSLFFNDPDKELNQAKPIIPDIDGEPFVDTDGQAYIYWRRRFASKMNNDYSELIGETISIPTKYSGYSEGPVLFRRGDLYYYVYTLSGHANYCNGYMISRHGPLGPFEIPEGNSIFIHSSLENGVWGPGHGNVFQMPGTDDFYFLYLEYGEGGTTRQVFANKMEFNKDGTIKPLVPDNVGMGYLAGKAEQRVNLALAAKAQASSTKETRTVKTRIIPDPNVLATLQVNPREGEPVSRNFDYAPSNAIDGSNGTRWMAEPGDKIPSIVVDMGKTKLVSECHISFVLPTYGHSWTLEASTNGKKWKKIGEETSKAVKSPHIARGIGKARFLKLTITEGEAGIWEMKIF